MSESERERARASENDNVGEGAKREKNLEPGGARDDGDNAGGRRPDGAGTVRYIPLLRYIPSYYSELDDDNCSPGAGAALFRRAGRRARACRCHRRRRRHPPVDFSAAACLAAIDAAAPVVVASLRHENPSGTPARALALFVYPQTPFVVVIVVCRRR